MWEFPSFFCARIGLMQLGVVLVLTCICDCFQAEEFKLQANSELRFEVETKATVELEVSTTIYFSQLIIFLMREYLKRKYIPVQVSCLSHLPSVSIDILLRHCRHFS